KLIRWWNIINVVFYKHLKRSKSVTITLVQQMVMDMMIVEEKHLKRYMQMYLAEKMLLFVHKLFQVHMLSLQHYLDYYVPMMNYYILPVVRMIHWMKSSVSVVKNLAHYKSYK